MSTVRAILYVMACVVLLALIAGAVWVTWLPTWTDVPGPGRGF